MNHVMLLMTEATKSNVLKSLEIMWKGLVAIFIVIGIIAVITFIMNDISSRKAQGKNFFGKPRAPEKSEENGSAEERTEP